MRILRLLLVILLLIGSVVPVWGAELPEELTDALPADAEQLLDGLNGEFSDHDSLVEGFTLLWDSARGYFSELLRENFGSLVLLLGVVLLCGVMEELHRTVEQEKTDLVPMAGALAITTLSVGNFRSLIGMGVETMDRLDLFAKTLLPTLSAAVAAGGGVVTASMAQVATVYFANVLISLIRSVLLPLTGCYIAAALADAVLPGHDLKRIRTGIAKAVTWGLTGLLMVFTGFLKLTGSAGSAADSTAAHLTRSTISAAVPVVGGIISEATETVTAGAGLLKSTIGIFGTLGIFSICLVPFVHLAVQYLLYKLTAFLASTVGSEPLIKLIDALGTVFGLILGMAGACAMLLLIAVISSVSVVVT